MTILRSTLLCTAALFCAAPLTTARANSPVFSASVSGYTAIENRAITAADRVAVETTQQNSSNRAEATGQGGRLLSYSLFDPNSTGFTSASAEGYALAQPGLLRVYGGVRSVATDFRNNTSGTLSPSGYNVSSNISAGASFTDTITIGATGLAQGALVKLPIRFLAEMLSNYPLGYPVNSFHALTAYAAFTVPVLGPQVFSTESGFFPFTVTPVVDGIRLYSVRADDFTVDVHVGDVYEVGAVFGVGGQANVPNSFQLTDFGGFVDARNTAALWFGELPEGVFISSASGHHYTIDPMAAVVTTPVPEPETYALMLAGLLATGVALRRRRA